jgi:hypothetical protein
MGRKALTVRLMATILAFAAVPVAADSSDSDFAGSWLSAHNRERAHLGMPALRWSPKLAAEAQAWANTLVRRGVFEHSQQRGDAGENLWMGSAGYYYPEEMIGAFLDEKRDFRPGKFPNVSRSGNWHGVGHYSQIIWRDTREVGCALAEGRGREVLVCRYWPAGNVYGEYVG